VPSGEGLSPGPDGRPRCRWATSTEDYIAYHDAEWGRPVTDDRAMFERICLEAFQSGLSWLTILRKRDGFRAAFHGFDFDALATFGDGDIDRLLADGSIVRNRAKIEATIANAGATAEMAADGESLAQLVWSFAPARDGAPAAMADIPSTTEESKALAKELKRRGFRFVGPTTVYAMMQAVGVVNDHLATCFVRDEIEALRSVE
jgi:DNA-3-methyladenine glycosylase I